MEENSAAAANARLVVLNGDFEGMVYHLGNEETLIGRNPTTDITLLDDGISREHALILFEESDNTFVIEDLQSTNGTKVNGKRVRSATLNDRDEVRVGNTCFQFEEGGTNPP
jgi:pSer/pThr/pTyr-binding forkhead associated (FHA) protein